MHCAIRGQRIRVGESGGNLPIDRSYLTTQTSQFGDAMAEYDSPSHMPDGVAPNVWERLVVARRRKIENEQKVYPQLGDYYTLLRYIGQIHGITTSRDAVIFTKPNSRG